MATALAVLTASDQTSQATTVEVSSQAPTYLYGGQASKLDRDVKKRDGDNFAWKVSGAVTWEVQIAKSGEYTVGLCHAAEPGAAEQELQIAGGGGQLNYTQRSTEGAFRGKGPPTPPRPRCMGKAAAMSIPSWPTRSSLIRHKETTG
jgi:hypothetical protein